MSEPDWKLPLLRLAEQFRAGAVQHPGLQLSLTEIPPGADDSRLFDNWARSVERGALALTPLPRKPGEPVRVATIEGSSAAVRHFSHLSQSAAAAIPPTFRTGLMEDTLRAADPHRMRPGEPPFGAWALYIFQCLWEGGSGYFREGTDAAGVKLSQLMLDPFTASEMAIERTVTPREQPAPPPNLGSPADLLEKCRVESHLTESSRHSGPTLIALGARTVWAEMRHLATFGGFGPISDLPPAPDWKTLGDADSAQDVICEVMRWCERKIGVSPTVAAMPTQEFAGNEKPRTGRGRRKPPASNVRPMTERQIEALRVIGECNGNEAEAARRLGITRTTFRQHLKAANRKAGKSLVSKPKTRELPTDRRGQAAIDRDRRAEE